MTLDPDRSPKPSLSWILTVGLAALIGVFVISDAVALASMRAVLKSDRVIVGDALESINLVTRLDGDIDQERLVIDARIFETDPSEAKRLEQQLTDLDRNFDAAAEEYAPLTTFPGEREIWQRVRGQVEALKQPLHRALDLSRQHQEQAALAQMHHLQSAFEGIDHEIDDLVAINRHEASRQVDAMARHQRRALFLMVLLSIAGVTIALLLAVVLGRTIRRRERENTALTRALEDRNRELDSFSGRVAHDLRGPLTVVHLATSRLVERQTSAELGTIAMLERGVRRMDSLIQDLLALSRIGSELRGTTCDPSAVAESLADELRPQLENEGGGLDLDVEPRNVACTEGLLRQALWNILSNALKYRRPDVAPKVEVRGRVEDGQYVLQLSDNGMGMSPTDAQHAFEPFYRAERSQSQAGTGLGLAIVKRIIEAHGGTVRLESSVAVGTTFIITLRLANGDLPAATERMPVPRGTLARAGEDARPSDDPWHG